MIGAKMIIKRCNALLQHVFIVIKPYIILMPSCAESDVLMGQERAEHDGQAKQALQCAHYFIYTDNCIGGARRLLVMFCGSSGEPRCYLQGSKQGLQRAHYFIYTDNCMGGARRLLVMLRHSRHKG